MIRDENFDVVIVGSGLGGASAAYRLSSHGFKVAVLEKGAWPRRDDGDWRAENILLNSRYFGSDQVGVRQYEAKRDKLTSFNQNVGGMSVFYGGAAFRLREQDFDGWALSYSDFSPYYDEAESLLEVHGQMKEDPTEPPRQKDFPFAPIDFNPPAQRIYNAAQRLGLRPFHIPLAINFKNQARDNLCVQCQTCDGYPCKIEAKNDATTIFKKAMKNERPPKIFVGVTADRFVISKDRMESLEIIDSEGSRFSIKAKAFILAAGALGSPLILLRTDLQNFPQQNMIGRYLMRHCNAVVSYVFPFRTNARGDFHKQVAISHLYNDWRSKNNLATGIIQDIYTPEKSVVSAFAPRGFKFLAGTFSQYIQNLLCVAEDEPQFINRVELSDRVNSFGMRLPRIEHRYSEADLERLGYLIKHARQILKTAGGKIGKLMKIDSFSHAVGTLRMGQSEKDSVISADGQFHGLKNLFVADGSFMPSSGGVNPSLSITAFALRTADQMIKKQEEWGGRIDY